MHLFPNAKTFLEIGPLTIQYYALLIVIGALCAYGLSIYHLRKMKLAKEITEDLFMGVFFWGIVGARIWYVVFAYKDFYAGRPFFDMFKIWEGGLAIQGGVIAALIYSVWFARKHQINYMRAADAIMPNLLVAQAIGRWGNFINQEAHGTAVSLEFLESLHLPQFIIDGMHINGVYYHPTFLYESLGNLCVYLIIMFIVARFYKKHGTLFSSYFIGYGVVRIFVEGLRTDSLMFGTIRMAQLTGFAGILFGLALLLYLHKKGENVTAEQRVHFGK